VQNIEQWPLNGPLSALQAGYDKCIGHIRLCNCVHGKVLDISSLLGLKKTIFTTAISGTIYIKVTYEEGDKQ